MQFHVLRSSLLTVENTTVQDSPHQVISPAKHFLYCSVFLGYFFKDFGNWKREPKNNALGSSTTSEESDDDIENHGLHAFKFILSNINQKEEV